VAVLVSDGRDPERADFAARAQRVRARLAALRAELVVIAAGPDPDREILSALAGGADAVLDAGDLRAPGSGDRLLALLARASVSGSVREDAPIRLAPTGAPGLAQGLSDLPAPTLRRAVRARAAEGASSAWTVAGPDGGDALAVRRFGLGASAAFAFAPDADWVLAPGDLGAALRAALRRVAPPAERSRPRLVERDGELVLEHVVPDAPAVVLACLGTTTGRDLGTVALLAARAGHDPIAERSADLPGGLAGLADGELALAEVDLGGGPLRLAFAPARASEFARAPGVFEPPPGASGGSPDRPAPHPAAPWVLGAGLLALAAAAAQGFFSRPGR
jgi:hypothetical protein